MLDDVSFTGKSSTNLGGTLQKLREPDSPSLDSTIQMKKSQSDEVLIISPSQESPDKKVEFEIEVIAVKDESVIQIEKVKSKKRAKEYSDVEIQKSLYPLVSRFEESIDETMITSSLPVAKIGLSDD